jgi:hypothetical protein
MTDEILGQIDRSEDDTGDAVATIQYSSRPIQIHLVPDDQPFDVTLQLAREVVRRLGELDRAARNIAVAGLREVYNHGWRAYDEVQEDGSLKPISNPPLSEAEFASKLSLTAVTVTNRDIIEFFYDDSGLFAGHCVIVRSMNGMDFSGARAELFG